MGRKRKASKAVLEKQKAAAKKKAKKQDDDDYDDDEDDAYNMFSTRSMWENKSANPKPPVGSLEKCAKCSKQFTVVRISVAVYLHSCLHSSEDEIHGCCESFPGLSMPPLHQGLWS